MQRFDRYVAALWSDYGLLGVVVVVLLIAGVAWWFGVDAEMIAEWIGLDT